MSTAEDGYLHQNLRKVISLVDRLRDIGLQKYISLPRVAVLGAQSAGKSSVLEQIVGLDFLPRGSGVVTRRPLEMRLVYVPKDKISKPYAVFEETGEKKYEDFQEVKRTIEVLTDKIAGGKKGIVDKPIILKIYSSTCPDLTLIDLPGITRIPMKDSEQPENIEEITKEMCSRYCGDENTIILCVISANQDISTSDGLQLAQKLDPSGERTLGVFTKVDIMDKGTDAKSALLGNEIPLKLGYVGVVNRSNQDIKDGKIVLKHLEDEKIFFAKHPVYSTMEPKYCGTSNLTKRVVEVFYKHIRKFLPKLEIEMSNQITQKQAALEKLGTPLPETVKERLAFLWQIVNEFINQFKASLEGTYYKGSAVLKRVPLGSQVREILLDLYGDHYNTQICSKYTDSDIQKAIQRHEGDSIPGFPSLDAFMSLLVPQLRLLIGPANGAIHEVYILLEELTDAILDQILVKLPSLKSEIRQNIISELSAERQHTQQVVEDLINSEINYIFTNDQEFLMKGGFERPTKPIQAVQQPTYQQKPQNPMIEQLRQRVDSYFDVVVRSIRDSVPKLIGNFLIKKTQSQLRFTLFKTVQNAEQYFKYMNEPPQIALERKILREQIEIMTQSKQTIRKDPDLAYMFEQSVEGFGQKQKEHQAVNAQEKPQKHHNHNSTHQQQPQQDKRQQHSFSQQQNQNQAKVVAGENKAISNMFGVQKPNSNSNTNSGNSLNVPPPQQQQNQQRSQSNMFGNPSPTNNKQSGNAQNSNLFGAPKTSNQQQPQQQQSFVDKNVDKGVDKMFEDKGFQENMKKGANKGMYAAVDHYVPMKDKNGNNAVADFMGKQAEKAVENEKVQQEMKNQVKDQTKQNIQRKNNLFW